MIVYQWINFYQDQKEHPENLVSPEAEEVEEVDLEGVVEAQEDQEVVDFLEEEDFLEVDPQEAEEEVLEEETEEEIEEAKDLEEEDSNNDKLYYSINIWLERTLFIFSLFKMLF